MSGQSCKQCTKMYKNWKEKLFCDVTLVCGETRIDAHRIVLSSLSDYFKNVFKYAGDDSQTCVIDQEYIAHGHLFEMIVDYAYSGKIAINGENAQDLLVAGSFLQIDSIVNECERYLATRIDNIESDDIEDMVNNLAELVKLCNRFNLRELINSVCRFASNHFEDIKNASTIRELPPNDFCSIIRNKYMSVVIGGIPISNPEKEILKFVGKYISVASVSQAQFDTDTVSNLLKEIAFRDITPDDIQSVIDLYPLIKDDVVRNAFSHQHTSTDDGKFGNGLPLTKAVVLCQSRIYSNCRKQLYCGSAHADAGELSNIIGTFGEKWPDLEKYVNLRVKRIRIIIRYWRFRRVVCGLAVEYDNGRVVEYGGEPRNENVLASKHEFSLDENEVITKVVLRTGFLIDNLVFFTNLGHTFGPYGGQGGYKSTATSRCNPGYFHSFDGKEVLTDGEVGITCLSFRWVSYLINL